MVARSNTKDFVTKSFAVHGDKYDYSRVEYVKDCIKVEIVCPLHGAFSKAPNKHLNGQGCPVCSKLSLRKSNTKTSSMFKQDAALVHGDRYGYDLVDYVTAKAKVEIVCSVHGSFWQVADQHLTGSGCSSCGSEAMVAKCKSSIADFIESAEKVHGALYDYSEVQYRTAKTPVIIKCRQHGSFRQRPTNHLAGKGCQACARGGFKSNIPGWLYVLRDGPVTKIGITNRPVSVRTRNINNSSKKKFKPVLSILFENGSIPDQAETILLREMRQMYARPDDKFDGSSECFIDVDSTLLLSRITTVVGTLLTANQTI